MISRLIIKSTTDELPEETTLQVGDEVVVEYTVGEHYSGLWSLKITLDVWNGLPRIKHVGTLDNWSDR